jgi:hypothetical protein
MILAKVHGRPTSTRRVGRGADTPSFRRFRSGQNSDLGPNRKLEIVVCVYVTIDFGIVIDAYA